MTKQMVHCYDKEFYKCCIDGVKLPKIIELLKNKIAQCGEDAYLDIDTEQDGYESSVRATVSLIYSRLETDEEESAREGRDARMASVTLAQKREQLEKLKKELGE